MLLSRNSGCKDTAFLLFYKQLDRFSVYLFVYFS